MRARSWTILLTVVAMLPGSFAARGEEKLVIGDKTLVAWVSPANLTQRGGSVLTLEKPGGTFDAIVFGEIAPARWMAGSDGFARTKTEQEDFTAETDDSKSLVSIAIVYHGQQITLYRNGSKYAAYTAKGAERFGSDSLVLMGLRHMGANRDNCTSPAQSTMPACTALLWTPSRSRRSSPTNRQHHSRWPGGILKRGGPAIAWSCLPRRRSWETHASPTGDSISTPASPT